MHATLCVHACHSPQVFKGDGIVPQDALPAFDHASKDAIGACVLIPASKYPRFAVVDPDGREFLGWVGKIVAYEDKGKKLKVKIKDDRGFEKLPIDGSAKYAVSGLTRLV